MAQHPNAAELRLHRVPDLRSSYARALLRGTRHPKTADLTLPSAEMALDGVALDPLRLDAYARVCGYAAMDRVPAGYPQLLAFPAIMGLLTRPDFPLPLLGLVHIANRITGHRPLSITEPLDLAVRLADLRDHPRGTAFDAVIEARIGGELAWASTSTYLHRRASSQRSAPDQPAEPASAPEPTPAPLPPHAEHAATQSWYMPSDTGRRFAAVSGDRNPIHLYPLTARLFGFPRHIAHGMCTLARVVATCEPLPDAYVLEAEFRAPVMLPATVRLTTTTTPTTATPSATATAPESTIVETQDAAPLPQLEFTLTNADGTRVHLHGAVSAS